MSGFNKVIIVGRLSKDPEARTFPDGSISVSLTIPTSETWKDKTTGEKKETTEWNHIVAYRKIGEICQAYLSKGSMVCIEGKLKTRAWTDTAGIKKSMTEIIATGLKMLGGSDRKPPDDSDIEFDFGFNKNDVFSKAAGSKEISNLF